MILARAGGITYHNTRGPNLLGSLALFTSRGVDRIIPE
jgi:hypothetical protein